MRILLGMSGGVDSTYAALKLKSEGHEVEGAVLVMHEYTDTAAAELAAKEVGIPLHTVDARELFEKIVKKNFVDEYISARTPNPCVICNSEVKFKCLLDYATEHGFDMIATGHYAKILFNNGRYYVARGEDTKKDQSYMLWRLPEAILSKLLLPLSDLKKTDIVEMSKAAGISSAKSRESQEICFIPDGKYTEYIEAHAAPSGVGSFVDKSGMHLGEHRGIIHYTVGQRKGLEIALGRRMFVTEISAEKNTVTLEGAPRLSDTVYISGIVFSGLAPRDSGKVRLGVKVRYLANIVSAELEFLGGGKAVARLSVPERSVTPGQCAVFYDGDGVALGGYIDKSN